MAGQVSYGHGDAANVERRVDHLAAALTSPAMSSGGRTCSALVGDRICPADCAGNLHVVPEQRDLRRAGRPPGHCIGAVLRYTLLTSYACSSSVNAALRALARPLRLRWVTFVSTRVSPSGSSIAVTLMFPTPGA
jgi:hypothetical protein